MRHVRSAAVLATVALLLMGCDAGVGDDTPSPSGSAAAGSASADQIRRTLAGVDACALLTGSGADLQDVEASRPHRCEAMLDDYPVSLAIGVPFDLEERQPDELVELDGLSAYRSTTSERVVIAVGSTHGIAVTDRSDLPASVAHALAEDPDGFGVPQEEATYAACDLLAPAVSDADLLVDARGDRSADQGLDMCSVEAGTGAGLPQLALQHSDADIERAAGAASGRDAIFRIGAFPAYTRSLGESGCVVQVLIATSEDGAGSPRYTYAGFTAATCRDARDTARSAIGAMSTPPPADVPLGELLVRER